MASFPTGHGMLPVHFRHFILSCGEHQWRSSRRSRCDLLGCCVSTECKVQFKGWRGYAYYEMNDDETVLVDNKCQCVTVTSKFVPSKDNPNEEVLQRNVRIIVPLKSRENISDPSSPVRTKFVYKLSKLCDKCDSEGAKMDDQGIVAGKRTPCSHPEEPCYTYDRNKCYTASSLFSHGGKTLPIETALTPESCYPD